MEEKVLSRARVNGEVTLVVASKYLVGMIQDAYENMEAIHIASLHAKKIKYRKFMVRHTRKNLQELARTY